MLFRWNKTSAINNIHFQIYTLNGVGMQNLYQYIPFNKSEYDEVAYICEWSVSFTYLVLGCFGLV